MSAGGPIVEPKARLILLTPISPHTLNNRSIVLSSSDRVTIEILPPRSGKALSAECYFDGAAGVSLQSGDRINISSSVNTTRLIRISRQSFLETLHRKFTSV
jgi:NAD+ kinase